MVKAALLLAQNFFFAVKKMKPIVLERIFTLEIEEALLMAHVVNLQDRYLRFDAIFPLVSANGSITLMVT
jgi:hypothetical protein